jgi:hypothetical protein
MLEHRAAVQENLVQQEADLSRLPRPAVGQAVGRAVEGLHRFHLDREQVLQRLWELANLSPEKTRGSITGQVKAMSMIVAMENLIPNGRVALPEKKSPAGSAPSGPGSTQETPQTPGPSQSTSANRVSPSQAKPPVPYVPLFNSVPDLGIPLPIKNPFVYPR